MKYDEAVKLTERVIETCSISEEEFEKMKETVALLADPHIQIRNGPKCKFPDCWCNAPWEDCEEKYEIEKHHT